MSVACKGGDLTIDEQLNLWVNGESIHNKDREECCPDFSCCNPKLLAPTEIRELFVAARKSGNEKVSMRLLMEFLGRAMASLKPEMKVYIVGLEASKQEQDIAC